MCPHTALDVSSYCYISVLILVCMCPHTALDLIALVDYLAHILLVLNGVVQGGPKRVLKYLNAFLSTLMRSSVS